MVWRREIKGWTACQLSEFKGQDVCDTSLCYVGVVWLVLH